MSNILFNISLILVAMIFIAVAYIVIRRNSADTLRLLDAINTVGSSMDTTSSTLPRTILNTINGAISNRKGKVGELLVLSELTSNYDRVIVLGAPVDYICVGKYIDFIEVKSGNSTLTDTEKHIKSLVETGKVRFLTINKTIDVSECICKEDITTDG